MKLTKQQTPRIDNLRDIGEALLRYVTTYETVEWMAENNETTSTPHDVAYAAAIQFASKNVKQAFTIINEQS